MRNKIEHKTYGESKLEIPHGWYTVTEIEEMLEIAIIQDKACKEILEKARETYNTSFLISA